MKKKVFGGVIRSAHGKPLSELAVKEGFQPLPASVKYSTHVMEYETPEELRAANDWPKDADIVKMKNRDKKANERQKAMAAKLEELGVIKPTTENDPQLRLERMRDLYIDNGLSEEEAREKASASLGIDWED